MEHPNAQNLKYGIIYLYSDRRYSPGAHNPEAIVEKFVYPLQVKWIDEPGRSDLLLIARRFNVGNIGQYATVSLTLSRMNRSGGWFEAIRRFADELMGVTDMGEGDIVIDEFDYGYDYDDKSSVFNSMCEEAPTMPSAAPQDHTRVECSQQAKAKRGLVKRLKDKLESFLPEEEIIQRPVLRKRKEFSRTLKEPQRLENEECRELATIERERERDLEHIRQQIVNYIAQYHEDPKALMEELLIGKVIVGQQCRVLVNGDMKIVLPEYDEMEIKMPAMSRTLYILFMKLRKQGTGGVVLKNIDQYRDDIIDIYNLVKPGASERRVAQSVENLCDPFSDSLNQTISRVNRCIRNVIADKKLVEQYMITGARGEEYGIALDPELMELPRAVTGAE
jgi:hypothetical protein